MTGKTDSILSIISFGDKSTSIVKDLDMTGCGILSCGRFDIKITLPLNPKVFGSRGVLPVSGSIPSITFCSIVSSIASIDALGKD